MIFNFKDTTDAKTLDGHGAEYFATADSINNIIDGTTPVGKANQLSTARNINGVAFDGSKDVTVYDTRFITEDGAIVSSSPIKASGIESTGKLISNILTSSITQGGTVELSKPKDYLDADVNIDINGNNVRFFENGGGYRGASIDLTKCSSVSDTELLHTGNMADHVLPKTGGVIAGDLKGNPSNNGYYLLAKSANTSDDYGTLLRDYNLSGISYEFKVSANDQKGYLNNKEILHTGNSAKVHISPTAPSDTSALWVY